MKRDMDLVRFILLSAENSDEPLSLAKVMEYGCDAQVAAYHIDLMASHRLIEAKTTYASGHVPVVATVSGLTWEGYDYLDAIRSDRVWEKSKKAISESVGDTSLSVIKETCSALALATIKASLGI